MAKPVTSVPQWIPIVDAAELIRESAESTADAWTRLQVRLANGTVRTRATSCLSEWSDGWDATVQHDQPIPRSILLLDDLKLPTGNAEPIVYCSWRTEEQADLTVTLHGASLLLSDIEDMLRGAMPQKKRSTAGRPPATWWADFAEELAVYIHDAGPPSGTGATGQGTVVKAILDRLAKKRQDAPDRSSISPVVQNVLDRIR